jgi:hypothetical protein
MSAFAKRSLDGGDQDAPNSASKRNKEEAGIDTVNIKVIHFIVCFIYIKKMKIFLYSNYPFFFFNIYFSK